MKYLSSYEKSASLYDILDQTHNIEFFCRYANGLGEVLDVGAGTGCIAIPIAKEGINVYCVEPSPAMRREFRKKLKEHKDLAGRIVLAPGTAPAFRLNRTFEFAFMSGVFDHFLNDNFRLSVLRNMHRRREWFCGFCEPRENQRVAT